MQDRQMLDRTVHGIFFTSFGKGYVSATFRYSGFKAGDEELWVEAHFCSPKDQFDKTCKKITNYPHILDVKIPSWAMGDVKRFEKYYLTEVVNQLGPKWARRSTFVPSLSLDWMTVEDFNAVRFAQRMMKKNSPRETPTDVELFCKIFNITPLTINDLRV